MNSKLIEALNDIPTYEPSGHSGTTNRRLVTRGDAQTFEMVHGRLEPGGHAVRHSHTDNYQAMYVLSGRCEVALGEDAPVICGPASVVRIPPGTEHEVTSLGPEPLELIIVYAPPIS